MTLLEILIALVIFVVAAIIALTVYDLSRKSFKKGENLTEQQQSVRIAFDRLAADLRMAGFNYNPDGAANRPDEQIEAAFDTAIVIRADFDAEDPTAAATPEDTMIGTDFLSVSIGNDEIAAYVLAKPDGSSTGSLVFAADISNPRDGSVETVTIPNVAMVQDDPPYTLYRITFNNDDSTFGAASFFTRTPLIENVYSMNFRYFDQVGVQQNSTFDLTTVVDDIGGAETPDPLRERNAIRRFGVDLVGMTADPDPQYFDPDDPITATQRHRKFSLTSDIQPRNIGLIGVKDLTADVTPPSKPATPTLAPGHCGGILVSWSPNPTEDEVAYYRVNFSTTAGGVSASRNSNSTFYFLGGLNDAPT
jgi:type II secretory pathway pseudopilin PulG